MINLYQIRSGLLAPLILIIVVILQLIGCQSSGDKTAQIITQIGRNDAWKFIGIGGGGAMFWPSVSPHDPDYAYVACDMTGSYVTYDGGESWRMFNLRAPVKFFVFDPVDPNVVYARSIALFKSTDRGKNWNIIYPAPSDIAGIIAKGDHADEVVVTTDSTNRQVQALAVDPDNSMKLYAVIAIDNVVAFYYSDDQGRNWTREKELNIGARNIFVVPSSPIDNRLLYITGENSIAVRENGTWTTNAGPEHVGTLTSFAGGFDKSQNKFIIYTISGKSYFSSGGDPSGIYYTEDGGKTWENRQEALLQLHKNKADFPEWRTIATSAFHPETVYISYNDLQVDDDTTCFGVAKSEDFGKTWRLTWKDCLTRGGSKFAENYKKGWIGERFGPTWGENPFSIAVSPTEPDICYTTDLGRTIKTIDGGKTWEQVYTKKKEDGGWQTRGLEVTTNYNVVFDPFNIDHVFIATTDIGLMESTDGGESWNSATWNNGVPHNWVNTTYWLTFDPDVKGRAWAAMSGVHDIPRPKMWRRSSISGYKGGVVVTEDAGKNWKAVSKDIGEAAITHILIDPTSDPNSRTLYACAFGKGVYKSLDGGATWSKKNKGIEGKEPFAWKITRNETNGELFLVICRRSEDGTIGNEYDGAIYRSADGAENWLKMDLPSGTNGPVSIVIDPVNSEKLLLGAWGRVSTGRFSPDTGGGIFLSEDNGITWKQTLSRDQHIHDITYDSRNNSYYACGFNRSAYRSKDTGKTWIKIKGYNFKWGQRVEPDPRDPEMIFVLTFGGGLWFGPATDGQ